MFSSDTAVFFVFLFFCTSDLSRTQPKYIVIAELQFELKLVPINSDSIRIRQKDDVYIRMH